MRSSGRWRVGIDFDNTLICYDRVLYDLALERGLVTSSVPKRKGAIRDYVRSLPNGEFEWQRLQAEAYGPSIQAAAVCPGVEQLIRLRREHDFSVCIVSHKTEYAAQDSNRINLRTAALNWIEGQGLFGAEGLGLMPEQVYFEASAEQKVARIGVLGCTHFIDDLPETYLRRGLPNVLEKMLYAPYGQADPPPSVRVFQSWRDICGYLAATAG